MKTSIKNLSLLPALIAGFGLIPAGRVTAQTLTTLHSFTAFVSSTIVNSDGAHPLGGLILSGNSVYGTANFGGDSGSGTVFRVTTNGTDFTNLHSFTGGSDGASPWAGLILSGNTLYGTANGGGSSSRGLVFSLNTDGTDFTNLHSFTGGSDGANPVAGLILSGNTLYGTASAGGSSGNGTVFAVNTDGTGFTNLHSLAAVSDGATPRGGLILSGNILYGTASQGGSSGNGTVFALNTDGTGFTNLYSFTAASGTFPHMINSDGATPSAGLILSGDTLYGTAYSGGSLGYGALFKINTNGTGFTNLYNFDNGSGTGYPHSVLILSGDTLYGTAYGGGSAGYGAVFKINTDGTGFTNLHSFTISYIPIPATNSDGATPYAGLILSGNTLYGTAYNGGNLGKGTVFSLSLPPPQLTIIRSGANVVLRWPTNAAGFTLQSTTNLFPTAWSPVVQPAVTNSGQISVPVPTTVGRKFFRLESQ